MNKTLRDVTVAKAVLSTATRGLEALYQALNSEPLLTQFPAAIETLISHKGRVIVTGVGKSGHVGRKIAATLASTGTAAYFVHATEASHGDLGMVGPEDVIIALSKSGETRELADVIAYAKRFGIVLIGITARSGSTLDKACDIHLVLPDAPEAFEGVDAPTTSTSLQMAMGDCLAVALMQRRAFSAHDFKTFHPGGKLGAALKSVGELMHGLDEMPLVAPETPMGEVLITMSARRFGCVGVQDTDGHLSGIITDGDLRRSMDGLLTKTAQAVMTRDPKSVSPDLLAVEALKQMNERRITVLFVTQDQQPVGILHIHDLLRAGIA